MTLEGRGSRITWAYSGIARLTFGGGVRIFEYDVEICL